MAPTSALATSLASPHPPAAAPACRRPFGEAPPGAREPRTALQQQVAQAAPGIFSVAAGPPPQQEQQLPAVLAAPQQLMALPAAVAPLGGGGRQVQPAAKRARLAHVAVAADRAPAAHTPAEEASKAAGLFVGAW